MIRSSRNYYFARLSSTPSLFPMETIFVVSEHSEKPQCKCTAAFQLHMKNPPYECRDRYANNLPGGLLLPLTALIIRNEMLMTMLRNENSRLTMVVL